MPGTHVDFSAHERVLTNWNSQPERELCHHIQLMANILNNSNCVYSEKGVNLDALVFKDVDSRDVIPACSEYLYHVGLRDHDPLRVLSDTIEGGYGDTAGREIRRRIDIPLPLDWIEDHIGKLRSLISDVSVRTATALQWYDICDVI
jgi:hypothetical protein